MPAIILNNIAYHIKNTPVALNQISMSFDTKKYGIVGDNGIGKSTLLNIISGKLAPDTGEIQRHARLSQLPQLHQNLNGTVSDILGTTKLIEALRRIEQGHAHEDDFELIKNDWDLQNRIETSLKSFQLWPIDLNQPFDLLSGGQKTKALLAKLEIFQGDFILMDEPTNNLDQPARQHLYDHIASSKKGMIIISHNRTLLNKMDVIIELNQHGLSVYGGNYDFYEAEKTKKEQAVLQEIQSRKESHKKAKKLIQTRLERHQQNEAKGRKAKVAQIKGKGSYDKIAFKTQQGRSEKTNKRIRTQAERKISYANELLDQAESKFEIKEEIHATMDKTHIPNNKETLKIDNLTFGYDKPLFKNFNLLLLGSERAGITGPNGCGKSTLMKLITGALKPKCGDISIGVPHTVFFDQNVSFLDPSLTLTENFIKLNPGSTPFDAYSALATFNFRNKEAEKKHLSGGERMRAGLAITLASKTPPQFIILDEPTNHLDLKSIKAIETLLNLYQGAMLVISHDSVFLEKIGIKKYVKW